MAITMTPYCWYMSPLRHAKGIATIKEPCYLEDIHMRTTQTTFLHSRQPNMADGLRGLEPVVSTWGGYGWWEVGGDAMMYARETMETYRPSSTLRKAYGQIFCRYMYIHMCIYIYIYVCVYTRFIRPYFKGADEKDSRSLQRAVLQLQPTAAAMKSRHESLSRSSHTP